jgi:dolichol-phosphate mannosyltransferase
MELRKQRLCVVAPCYNEEEVLPLFYKELCRVVHALTPNLEVRMLFVDDGSSDGTLEVLNQIARRDDRVEIYSLSRNFGHQVALSAGLDVARGDAIVVMDSDLQHPPSMIPKLVDAWQEGRDVVWAVRERTEDATWTKRWTSDAFYIVFNGLSETRLEPGAADFCLLSRRAHRALRRMPERHRFIRGMVSWLGFSRSFIPYTAPPRAAGRSKYTMRRMIQLASDALLSFTARPLRIATRTGAAIVFASVAALAAMLGSSVVLWSQPGWSAVAALLCLLQGALLFAVGLVGEYVVKVYEEAKGRPLYVFKQRPASRSKSRRLLVAGDVADPADDLGKDAA